MTLDDTGFIEIGDAKLEYRMIGPRPDAAPTIVMLHEGLGSITQWGDFPGKLAEKTGAGVFAYARAGYGKSSPVALPRPLDYLQREATATLPKLLDTIALRRGILVGHSDGASIAAYYAGSHVDHRVRGVVLMAPHFFTEPMSLAAIAKTKSAYESTDLRARLARHHAHVDVAFRGWSDTWLNPAFQTGFDLTGALSHIRVPVLVMQGDADPYGTLAQVTVVVDKCRCPVETAVMEGVGHTPHREKPDETLDAVEGFFRRIDAARPL